MRFQDIPKFPFASYRVNISWTYLEQWIQQQEEYRWLELEPEYQRGYVWNDFQKTAYIEYRLRGGFSGRDLFWNSPNWMSYREDLATAKLEIVDGKQRLNTVREFLRGEVKAFEMYYTEWDEPIRGIEPDFIFHINNLADRKQILEWYISMNTGGSIHTEEDLAPAIRLLKEMK